MRLGPRNRWDDVSQADVTTGPTIGRLVCDDSMICELASELFSCCSSCIWQLGGTTREQTDCEVGLTRETAEHCKESEFEL